MVKASVKSNPIHGLGLFADEFIPKGTMTWKFNPQFDILFDPKEVEKMPWSARNEGEMRETRPNNIVIARSGATKQSLQ